MTGQDRDVCSYIPVQTYMMLLDPAAVLWCHQQAGRETVAWMRGLARVSVRAHTRSRDETRAQ